MQPPHLSISTSCLFCIPLPHFHSKHLQVNAHPPLSASFWIFHQLRMHSFPSHPHITLFNTFFKDAAPKYNPGGYARQMPPLSPEAPHRHPPTLVTVLSSGWIFNSMKITGLNKTATEWQENDLDSKYFWEMTKRGAVIRKLMVIRGGRSFLPSWCTFRENRCGTLALITIISPVCTVKACICGFAQSWQAVVSLCVCLCKCAFVLWVFKQLSRCLLVFHLPDMTVCFSSHGHLATPPPTVCCLFLTRQQA